MREIEQLSLVGRDPDRGRAGGAGRVRPEAAHPRLGAAARRASVNGEPSTLPPRERLCDDPPASGGRATSSTLDLPMPPERLYAHPDVRMDVGRVALRRGPLVYCVEEADNPGGPVQTLTLPRSVPLDDAWRIDLFGGAMTLKANAKRLVTGRESGALYSTDPPAAYDASLVALPYYLWANRTPGSMQVWVAELDG